MKIESGSMGTIIRPRRILFAEFAARMEHTRLPNEVCNDVRKVNDGRGLRGGQGKERVGCFLYDVRVFGIRRRRRGSSARLQPRTRRNGARKRGIKGAERTMANWTAAEKVRAGLRHAAVVCPNVT